MANQWLRLWHDMPNDPKWRTISRVSGQGIPSVIAVYLHLLVNASMNAIERGRTQGVCTEDIASALDLECEQIESIIKAMHGRVLTEAKLSGWEKRQPSREDGAAERSKAWRESQKDKQQRQLNVTERDRTDANATEHPDKDKDKDKDKTDPPLSPSGGKRGFVMPDWVPSDLFQDFKQMRKLKKKPLTDRATQFAIVNLSALRDSGEDISEIIKQSILHSWDTFYTLKDTRKKPGTQHRESGGLVL